MIGYRILIGPSTHAPHIEEVIIMQTNSGLHCEWTITMFVCFHVYPQRTSIGNQVQ